MKNIQETYRIKQFFTMRNEGLREAWLAMEQEPETSQFLYYNYVREIFRQTAWLNPAYIPVICCLLDKEGTICAIAPMKWNIGKRKWKMLADIQGCGEAGWLTRRDASDEEKAYMTSTLLNHLGHHAQLRRVLATSPLANQLRSRSEWRCTMSTNCVRIDFSDDIDGYLKTLRPSVRQNIRTAYNRMSRDGMAYELQIFDNKRPIDKQDWTEIMDLYLKRLFGKYKQKKVSNGLKIWYTHLFYRHIKHDTRSLHYLPNSWHAILYIGGKKAAFMSGFVSHALGKEKSIVVPRLAIDAEASFYSPGMVLVCETLRYLAANTEIRTLNLSRGEEKYKYDMGGTAYPTLDFML